MCLYSLGYTINHNEKENENEKKKNHIDTTLIDLGMAANIVNIKRVSS